MQVGTKGLALLALLVVLYTGCAMPATETTAADRSPDADSSLSGTLTIFAAASLTDAFTELADQFEEANPQVDLVLNFAGSQQLAQQLAQGAPADLFASANLRQMAVAVDAGRIVSGTQQLFARNRLVVITPGDNPAQIESLADLARPEVTIVLAASEVPVGQYTQDFLDKAAADPAFGPAYREGVLENVVSYENNVRVVLTKVQLGEADAGIVYTSDAGTESTGIADVYRISIPDALNTIAEYPIAAISDSQHPALSAQFVEFVLDAVGQSILAKYGFIPVSEPSAQPGAATAIQ